MLRSVFFDWNETEKSSNKILFFRYRHTTQVDQCLTSVGKSTEAKINLPDKFHHIFHFQFFLQMLQIFADQYEGWPSHSVGNSKIPQ